MKRWICVFLLLLAVAALVGCSRPTDGDDPSKTDDGTAFGEDLGELGIYDGYFTADESDIEIVCLSGSADAYTFSDGLLRFSALTEDSVYRLSGTLLGAIEIDITDAYTLELELSGLSVVSAQASAIRVLSADKVTLTAKADTENYIYDTRAALSEEEGYRGAIHSEADLVIGGRGALTVVSEENNGIHSKDDLKIKHLTLSVVCMDNALKGNDSVTVEDGSMMLIAKGGDGIKTTRSDISDKGKQRGTIHIQGGTHTVYAACDGLDAAYDVILEGEQTSLTVYTDKYSAYSEEVTATDEHVYYIRFPYSGYVFSVKHILSDGTVVWETASYHSTVSAGYRSYVYYTVPKQVDAKSMQLFIYDSDTPPAQEDSYLGVTEAMTPNEAYDTIAFESYGGGLGYGWTSYTTELQGGMGGPGGHGGPGGGMQEGNSEKGDHSTKGIKAANSILMTDGTLTVRSYDDALHANAEAVLENGETPTGNVTVSGGTLDLYSNDDGIHADGTLYIMGGTVTIENSYEGLEGTTVELAGGQTYITSRDDGINSTASIGTGVCITGGIHYVLSGGDGIDANSRTAYSGICFAGGRTVVISTSGGNSAIDTEQGYAYTGGYVLALMPASGMSNEATHCASFSSVGTKTTVHAKEGSYLTVEGADVTITVRMPSSATGLVILLGNSDAKASVKTTTSLSLNSVGVLWQ